MSKITLLKTILVIINYTFYHDNYMKNETLTDYPAHNPCLIFIACHIIICRQQKIISFKKLTSLLSHWFTLSSFFKAVTIQGINKLCAINLYFFKNCTVIFSFICYEKLVLFKERILLFS